MDSIRNRARENLPPVLLTLLSIVQAIALETLWDYASHRAELFEVTRAAALGWVQVSVCFFIIILIWLFYVGVVMRFRWTPTVPDLILPFFVGLIQLLLISVTARGEVGAWFLVIALITTTLHLLSHSLFRRARRDVENEEFFRYISPATWRTHAPNILFTMMTVLVGSWLWFTGDTGPTALLASALVLVVIGFEIRTVANFWRTSMGQG